MVCLTLTFSKIYLLEKEINERVIKNPFLMGRIFNRKDFLS